LLGKKHLNDPINPVTVNVNPIFAFLCHASSAVRIILRSANAN